MKKIIALASVSLLFAGCGNNQPPAESVDAGLSAQIQELTTAIEQVKATAEAALGQAQANQEAIGRAFGRRQLK